MELGPHTQSVLITLNFPLFNIKSNTNSRNGYGPLTSDMISSVTVVSWLTK